jgi:protein TonB
MTTDTPSSLSSASAPELHLSPAELAALQTEWRDAEAMTEMSDSMPESRDLPTEVTAVARHAPPFAATDMQTIPDHALHQRSQRSPSDPRSSPHRAEKSSAPDAIPLGAAGPAPLPPPDVEASESPLAQESVAVEVRRVLQRPQAVERNLRHRTLRADYGWLAQSLWDEVERVKRYPYLARVNHWEGQVMIQAVIRRNGEIPRIEVVESSGHAVLDADAVETVRRCAPLTLVHPLHRHEISLYIPILYRLD